jgi:hypothetical protein
LDSFKDASFHIGVQSSAAGSIASVSVDGREIEIGATNQVAFGGFTGYKMQRQERESELEDSLQSTPEKR